jgi:hypothetical protein
MKPVLLLLVFAALTLPCLAQEGKAAANPSPDAHEISYAVVRTSQLQYLNVADTSGLKELLEVWIASDVLALHARTAVPELVSPEERARAFRVLRLIAAMHERHPIATIASNPKAVEALENAKRENACEYTLQRGRDWSKPLQSLSVAGCERSLGK